MQYVLNPGEFKEVYKCLKPFAKGSEGIDIIERNILIFMLELANDCAECKALIPAHELYAAALRAAWTDRKITITEATLLSAIAVALEINSKDRLSLEVKVHAELGPNAAAQ